MIRPSDHQSEPAEREQAEKTSAAGEQGCRIIIPGEPRKRRGGQIRQGLATRGNTADV